MKILLGLMILVVVGLFWGRLKAEDKVEVGSTAEIKNVSPTLTPTPTISIKPTEKIGIKNKELVEPVADFKNRITKKFFGTYITPKNSPVQPEKFMGFHTGVDVEFDEISAVIVSAIANGTVVTSKYATGYGGVVVIKHKDFFAIYGHLQPSSMIKSGKNVYVGEQIGVLGKGFSNETDGERKHLHFGISKTNTIKGYVGNKFELANWIDPMTLFD